MFQLDDDFLQQVSLGDMPQDEKGAFLQHIYKELETRLGVELSKDLTDEQLDNFGEVVKAGKEEEVKAWLDEHCPGYQKVVDAEIERLRQEIVQSSARLLNREPSGDS